MSIPHPIAIQRFPPFEMVQRLLGEERMEALNERIARDDLFFIDVLGPFRNDKKMISALGGALSVANTSGLLAPLRFQSWGTKIFEIDPGLSRMLEETDIGNQAPVSSFILPFESIYIHFPEPVNLSVGQDPDHGYANRYMTGAYIFTVHSQRKEWLEMYGQDFRAFELAFVSDFPADNPEDCLTLHSTLIFKKDDTLPLEDAINQILDDYIRRGYKFGLTDSEAQFRKLLTGLTSHITKCLLFISTPDAVMTENDELDESIARLERLGKGKRGKFERRMRNHFNRIVISCKWDPVDLDHQAMDAHTARRPHWRRGHFRQQAFGEGRKERRTIWIRPTLVTGEGELIGSSYKVKR